MIIDFLQYFLSISVFAYICSRKAYWLFRLLYRINFVKLGIHNMEEDSEFCPNCKNILPPIALKGTVECYLCKTFVPVQATKKLEYVIHFNSLQNTVIVNKETNNNEALGPIVERKCPKCGNNEMSYATVQLRSADEGQTVFFTCTNCKYTESENS